MATPTRVNIHGILKDWDLNRLIARLIGQGSIRDGRQYSLHRGRFRILRSRGRLWWWSWMNLWILLVKMRHWRSNTGLPISAIPIFTFWLFSEEFRMSLGFSFRRLRALEIGEEGSDLRAELRVEGAMIMVNGDERLIELQLQQTSAKSKSRDAQISWCYDRKKELLGGTRIYCECMYWFVYRA